MKFAYADPPYLGQAKLYKEHPEAFAWDDPENHRRLIQRLCDDFPDGWAMSCSTPSLRTILPMCPENARIGAWVKTFSAFKKGVRPAFAWEPVIWLGGRNPTTGHPHPPPLLGGKQTTPKDFFESNFGPDTLPEGIACPIQLKAGLTGAKPPAFCDWILWLLNFQLGDEMHDLFPGTGAMGAAVARFVG